MTQIYQKLIRIKDRDYKEWEISYLNDDDPDKIKNIDPIQNKLFDGDVFYFENDVVSFKQSPLRDKKQLCGILILGQNKTFGKYKNKLLFKCIPFDKNYPMFLIPYEQKNNFNKNYKNKYVIFKFDNWEQRHPIGKLMNSFGDVDNLNAFYQYQLNCRDLNISYKKFMNGTVGIGKRKKGECVKELLNYYNNIVNLEEEEVFTIDPEGCLDFDDAVSIQKDKKAKYVLRIYISNVSLWLDFFQLWGIFSDRVSTIYFPDKNYPMIPTILSNGLCSLQENQTRIAFVCELHIRKLKIEEIKFFNAKIRVRKNYTYDDKTLATDTNYLRLYNLTKNLNEEKDTSYLPFVYDSHDVVAYLMIMMNHLCACDMGTHKNGIYRSILMKEESIGTVPEKIRTFISLLRNSTGSKYVLYNNEIGHAILNLNEYVQITSPIRRLVDLLNMICFQDNHSITKWKHLRDKENFYNGWLERLDYVNDVMKQIKKAQNDCNALHICLTSPEILENFYDGYIIEREENKSKDLFQYSVYLNEHKMIVKMKSMEKYEIYSEHKFKIFVFQDENSLKQKIRVQLF